MTSPSVFARIPPERWTAANDLVFAVLDTDPVSPGHTLLVPKRQIVTWFDATAEETAALGSLLAEVKRHLDAEYRPDGYNVGFNAGAAAGQTVFHAHLHVIPRHRGDVPDPTGGVRHAVLGPRARPGTTARGPRRG
uniref:HIT family protein n=1 Tax=Neobacillus citreus TaxID=2833578 RepID=A0A942YEC7_9BACI